MKKQAIAEVQEERWMKKHALAKGADEIWTAILNVSWESYHVADGSQPLKPNMSMDAGEGPVMVWHDMLLEPQKCGLTLKCWLIWIATAEADSETTTGEVLGDVRRLCTPLEPNAFVCKNFKNYHLKLKSMKLILLVSFPNFGN